MKGPVGSLAPWLALWVALHLPTIAVAGVLWGRTGAAAYAILSLILVLAGGPWLWSKAQRLHEGTRRTLAQFGTSASLLVLLFLTPRHAGIVGFGSDRNECATAGALAILQGQNPYDWRSSLGTPVSQLAGELISAAPVVALTGNAAWSLVIWWLLWILVLAWSVPDGRRGLAALGLLALATSPMVVYQASLGEDLLWTGLQVAVALALFVRYVPDPEVGIARKILIAALVGVSLASRVSWALAFLPLFTIPRSRAWALMAVATWVALVVPFWLVSDEFGPLKNPVRALSTSGRIALVLGAAATALAIARHRPRTVPRLLGEVALVQIGLVIASTIVNSVAFGQLHLGTLGYAALAQGCAVGAAVGALLTDSHGAGTKSRPHCDERTPYIKT